MRLLLLRMRQLATICNLLMKPPLMLLPFAASRKQMLQLKAAGHPMWYHPSSQTTGRRFANGSPALLARQAAHLTAAWHIYTCGRPAECFRMRWHDSSVPGVDGAPPVWALGLADILKLFQAMPQWCWLCHGG